MEGGREGGVRGRNRGGQMSAGVARWDRGDKQVEEGGGMRA